MKYLIVVALTFFATGAEPRWAEPDGHIEKLAVGEYWMGAKVTPKELIGKVVLLEYWGS